MYTLRIATSPDWSEAALANFDDFLIDHAAAEKKVSGMAVFMLSHYADKPDIMSAMTNLAIEEMTYSREVVKILYGRGLQLGNDYVNRLHKTMRKGTEVYMLDPLLVGASLKPAAVSASGSSPNRKRVTEDLFITLASQYFSDGEICARLDELLDVEACSVRELPIRAVLH